VTGGFVGQPGFVAQPYSPQSSFFGAGGCSQYGGVPQCPLGGQLTAVYRYWQAQNHDHFYTQNAGEIGATQHGQTGNHGYQCEGVLCHLSSTPLPGWVPVYRYWKAGSNDHFYTANAGEIGATQHGQSGNHGYQCEGTLGYISPVQSAGTIPIFRYWNASNNDHFYTANAGEIGASQQGQSGNHGYQCEGVLGYAYP